MGVALGVAFSVRRALVPGLWEVTAGLLDAAPVVATCDSEASAERLCEALGSVVEIAEAEGGGPERPSFRWVVELEVSSGWVADGFEVSDFRALDMLAEALPYAHMSSELAARVLAAPNPEAIAREQGYESVAHRAAREAGAVGA